MVFECKDKKLISGSVEYFASRGTLKEIFVSEDGQYFESVSRSNYHCKARGLKLFRIERAQIPKSAPEAPKAEAPKAEAPKAEAPKAEAPKAEAPKAEVETKKAPEAKKGTGTAKKPPTKKSE